MPHKIKTVSTALLFIFTFAVTIFAQTLTPVNAPSSAEIMRDRIAKAKAFIVVKNFNAAIYELENIKRESADPALDSVINVLLMNSFLEQGDYKRAQDFLHGLAKDQKAGKPNAAANYFAVAAQVIRCSRTQLERYNSLGLNVSDRTLPETAAADVEKMRNILELVVDQSKELGKDKKYMDSAIALLDGATTARSNLAKDDYDAIRWRKEVGDAREDMASSRSTVINAVNVPPIAGNNTASVQSESKPAETNTVLLPVANENPASQPTARKPSGETVAKLDRPLETPDAETQPPKANEKPPADPASANRNRVVVRSAPKTEPAVDEAKSEPENAATSENPVKDDSPLEVGSLIGYATRKTSPIYPTIARNMRMTGVVKVEVLLDEDGKVTSVQNTDGPMLLQTAAQDAVKKWKFTPFKRDGEPVKATGFISFNFSL